MPFFKTPTSFRGSNGLSEGLNLESVASWRIPSPPNHLQSPIALKHSPLPPHASHPDLPHLAMLVFEAVLEVVCVSLPGYIVARQGMFTAEMQKFTANLNVALFTPCLIFTKLASQLTADKLVDLAIIPAIFIVQTLVSYFCALAIARLFGFARRPRNFVIAMGVFGNSNSLPISLVLSLSQTIRGLHWDKMPGDNDDEVAARGILYLLIFQQLGQLVRWSWGYNVLLAPPDKIEQTRENISSGMERGDAQAADERQRLLDDPRTTDGERNYGSGSDETTSVPGTVGPASASGSGNDAPFCSGEQTPVTHQQHTLAPSSKIQAPEGMAASLDGGSKDSSAKPNRDDQNGMRQIQRSLQRIRELGLRWKRSAERAGQTAYTALIKRTYSTYGMLPKSLKRFLNVTIGWLGRFLSGVWEFMNPPLWAMLAAIVVASIPELQRFFFADGTFFKNSVTSAIRQSGGVAVPLILVVLGGNLARNTLPDEHHSVQEDKEETKLLIAALISRMLLPLVVMAPLLAVTAKYIPISILDDPIFIIVCFLITGAPTALQLAQICQINNVYMGAMSRLLFQSYVVWILPSTLVLVMCALEVVEWAQQ